VLKNFSRYSNRFDLWADFISENELRSVAEIGVYRGNFAARILASAAVIDSYTMIDPWRFIPSWNKPANNSDLYFEECFNSTLKATSFAAAKLRILRGTTVEVISRIPDASLDFVYIDGDHTLKGIAIDLISIYPKIKDGGWIAGDDFCDSVWQHDPMYEPTMVFPFATYFAEAYDLTVYALPHNQFVMRKMQDGYSFIDLAGIFGDTSVRRHLLVQS
jgi:hypothetical protein